MIAQVGAMEKDYNAILTMIDGQQYEEAEEKIEDFMALYPDSKHYEEIKEKKGEVVEQIKKIEAEKKAAEAEAKKKAEAEKKKKEEAEKKKSKAKSAGVSLAAFEKMLAACEKIGISYKSISNIKAEDDWASGKRCSFDYGGYNFLVYFNQNESVNSINSGNVKFYKDGKKVENVNDRIVTSDEKVQLKIWAEDHIKTILKSPSTAEFPGSFLSPYDGWNFSKKGGKYTVSSYVDSQNSFGATLRSDFTIVYQWDGESRKVSSLIFDGEKIF